MHKTQLKMVWPGLAVLLAVSVAWAMTPDQVAGRIRNQITEAWQVSNLRVAVTPHPGNQGASGAYRQIMVTADSVTIDGVKLTGVTMGADNPVLDLAKLRANQIALKSASGNTIRARIGESELNKALVYKKNTIQNLKVKVGQGSIVFTGTYKYGVATNLRLEGRLETPDGYRINFVPTRGSVGGVPLPVAVLRKVLAKMNPLIDLKTVPLSPKLNKLIVEPGCIQLVG